MTTATRRPVPHVEVTAEITTAADAARTALLGAEPLNFYDTNAVRAAIHRITREFEDPAFFAEGDGDDLKYQQMGARRLLALATLLDAHLKAGNR